MGQVIDLGTGTFENPRQRQCLLSRTTATVVFQDDAANQTSHITHAADLKDVWVTVKRELTITLRLETSWRSVTSLSAVVKQLVEAMEAILIRIGSHLHVSRTSQESYSSSDSVTVQVSMALCESFDCPRDSLRGKLPRLVRGCILEDPNPPPEITIGTMSQITIHLRTPASCSPWDIGLTKMWLQEFHPNFLTEKKAFSSSHFREKHRTISLRPHKMSLPRSYHGRSPFGQNVGCGDTDKQSLRNTSKCLNEKFTAIAENNWGLGPLLDYSIQSLISRQPRRRIEGLGEFRSANAFSLSEVAPLSFSPGYCDNIRYRAGLLPVVTKSIGLLFRKRPSSTPMAQVNSTEIRLRLLFGHSAKAEANDLRPFIRSTMWKALQRGIYKPSSVTFPTYPATSSLENDTMLMEEWDFWSESDEELLSSYEDEILLSMASHIPLSHGPLELFPKEEANECEPENDITVFEWENSYDECDFNSQLYDEKRESMCWSSSLNLETSSDITIENAPSCGTAFLCESVADSEYSKAYSDSSIMENSISLPILTAFPRTASATFHDIPLTPTSIIDGDDIDIIISDLGHHLNEDTASIESFLAT